MNTAERKMLQVGDKVHITEYYLTQYPGWTDALKEGTVIKLFPEHSFPPTAFGANDLAKYRNHYGPMDEYPVVSMLIKLGDFEYLVSQLGFDKK